MLKRFLKFFAGVATASLALVACTKSQNEVTETLKVTPDDALTFEAKGNADILLAVTTNADEWKAAASADWIVIVQDAKKGGLKVNVNDNETGKTRLGRVTVTAGFAQPVAINIVQKASEMVGDGVAVKLNAKSELKMSAKTETELSVKVTVSVAEAAKEDVEVKLLFDGGYLAEYNYLNDAELEIFPEDRINFPLGRNVKIEAGKTESEEIEVRLDVTTLSLGPSYLVPLFLEAVDNALVRQSDCRVNVTVSRINPKAVKNVVYIEVNDCNPLNALEYELEDGTPFIDAVILFAANINYNSVDDLVYLSNNPNVQALLDESDIYLQPLRKKGIKVYLGLLGNHDAAGLCQLSDWGAAEWAKEVAQACKTYKLDGVNLDDEYSSSPDTSKKWFVSRSSAAGSRLCYELKKALAKECPWPTEVSYFAWGSLYTCSNVIDKETNETHTPGDFIDFYVANYGGSTSPYSDLTMANCSGNSIQLNYKNTISQSKAEEIKQAGYGWIMWFAFDPSGTGTVNNNREHSLTQFNNVAKGLYGQGVKEPTGVWNKLGEGKYDPVRHTL